MTAKLLKEHSIEHGNNEFGRFVKFYNGVLICWRYISISPYYMYPWGNMHFFAFQNMQYSHIFVDAPFVSITNIGGSTYIVGQVKRDNEKITECELFKHDNNVKGAEFYIFAIGRWK